VTDQPERGAALAVVAAHLVGATVGWLRLPGALPVRGWVDAEGTGWGQVGAVSWFSLPVASLLLVLLVWVAAARLAGRPLFMGLEAKGRFRRLEEECRRRVLAQLRKGMELAALPVAFVFFLVQIGMFQAAMGRSSIPWTGGALILSLLGFSALPAYLRRRAEAAVGREWTRSGRG
jgi:hypothetical protein